MLSKTSAGQGFLAKLAALIGGEEGESLTAYQDTGGAWTIGKGHLIKPTDTVDGQALYPYGPVTTITQAQSDAFFATDTAAAQNAVASSVHVPLTDNERAALVSLAFNIGAGAFAASTLVRLLNVGDVQGAADQFLVWNHDNGVVVASLTARRQNERALFLTA